MGFSARTKVLAGVAVGVVVITGASFRALGEMHERNAEAAAFHSLRSVARFFDTFERGDADKLSAALDVLLANDDLRRAFLARDREALQRAAAPLFADLKEHGGITHWYFIEPDHRCFLRVHAPEKHGDRIDRMTLDIAAKTGQIAAGKELGRTAFALRVVRPYRDREGNLVGFMELGEEIDHFLVRMKEHTGDDFALVVKKKFLDPEAWADLSGPARNTWNDRPDVVVVDTTSFTSGLVDHQGDLEQIPEEGLFLEEYVEGEHAFIRGAFPVRDAAGRKVGALFVRHDFSRIHAAFQAGQRRGLFVVLGLSLALVTLLGFALDLLVFARLRRIRDGLAALLRRDGGARRLPASFHGEDELGQLELLVAERGSAPAQEEPLRRAP